MSESSGLGATSGRTDQADGIVYDSGDERSGSFQDDGQPVGAADVAADRIDSGVDSDRDDDVAEKNTYDPLEDDLPATEDGQVLGAADRDADVDRTS
jgi:hypothetical protein